MTDMCVLLVPFDLEAYVKNDKNLREFDIAPITPDYKRLENETHLGGKLEPRPFERIKPFEAGVHLHFILPDAMTHATASAEGGLSYPRIPNRWLVTRLCLGTQIKAKSWMIESDYLGLDNTDSITVPYPGDKNVPYRRLGRSYPAGTEPEKSLSYEPLTAVGPGDAIFAAYYPSCRSVLGFHDKLEDIDTGNLTYFVMGYYSSPALDPLHGLTEDEYTGYLNQNKWIVPDGAKQAHMLVCHGMVYSLQWRGSHVDYPSGKPTGLINSSLGNTSVEALSALIAARLQDKTNIDDMGAQALERLLAATQYELHDEMAGMDGIAESEDLIHAREFDPSDGGKKWHVRIVNAPEADEKQILPEGIDELLTELNVAQSVSDGLERRLEWLQNALFSAWSYYVYLIEDPPPPPRKPKPTKQEILDEINRLFELFDEFSIHEDKVGKELAKAKKSLEDVITKSEGTLILENTSDGAFFKAREPVILLAGEGINRPYAYGHDGLLACRTETVNGLKGLKASLNLDDIIAYCDKLSGLPSPFEELLCEAICLSPELVAKIAAEVGEKSLEPIGQKPSEIAVSEWFQPWITLLIEWKVSYYPTRTSTAPDNSMADWEFNEIDYVYKGKTKPKPSVYTGRTVLTPHSAKLLKNTLEPRLERYKDQPELYEKLLKSLEAIENLAVVSQQLSGFRVQLLSKLATMQLPVMERDNYKKLAEDVGARLKEAPSLLTTVIDAQFLPVRAGFLALEQVNVINSFGLSQLIDSYLNETVFSEQLKNSTGENKGVLPPRYSQGARLCFDWISRRNEKTVSSIDPKDSPVCGYIYPDILNRCLRIYEYSGAYKGSLKLVYRNKKPGVRWWSAPGEPSDFEKINFLSTHLRDYAAALLRHKDDSAFHALMHLIDKRFESSCAYSGGDELAVLWGRPLVLSRARLKLELESPPAFSQSPEDFGKNITYDFESNKMPVYIGDIARSLDGTIGFFTDKNDRYDIMKCAYKASWTEDSAGYLLYGAPLTLTPADSEGVCVTILMEANSKICVRMGFLPAQQIRLSGEQLGEGLAHARLAFEVSPSLSDPNEIFLPLPRDDDAEWTWHYPAGDAYVDMGEVKTPESVFRDDNPVLTDGYLMRRERKA